MSKHLLLPQPPLTPAQISLGKDVEIRRLNDVLAAVTLRWSTEKPTVAGLYWWTNRTYPPIVVQVVQYGHELGFYRICDPVWHVELDGEWAGPLEMPS